MNLTDISKRAARVIFDNSPAILTAVGVTGTLTTAYLASRASFKAAVLLQRDEEEATLREKAGRVWKLYIPAGATAALTITSIIFSQKIGARRAAALSAAFAITEKAFEEYKDKVVEKFGEKKEEGIRDEIAQDRVTRTPASSSQVILAEPGGVMCFDAFSGRYFRSDMQRIRTAMNNINEQVINNSFASLSEFYDELDLPYTSISSEVGWNTDKLLHVKFSSTLSDKDEPVLVIDYTVAPIRFYRVQ